MAAVRASADDNGVEVLREHPEGDLEQATLGVGEALVRVHLAGICATDLEIIRGYKGGFTGVLGHEFVGHVVRTHPQVPTPIPPNTRVVGEINCVAHHDDPHQAHASHTHRSHHPKRTALGIFGRHGAFARFVIVPAVNLHRVPPSLPDRLAVFVEPTAAALQVLRRAPQAFRPDATVAVLGVGKLGLLVAQVIAAETSCRVLALARSSRRAASVAQVVRGLDIRGLSDVAGKRFDVVVECTGSADGFGTAVALTVPCGTLCLKTTVAGGTAVAALNRVVVDEIAVVGSRCGPFEPAIRLLDDRRVLVEPMISASYHVDNAREAFEHAAQPGTLKVLLEMNSP